MRTSTSSRLMAAALGLSAGLLSIPAWSQTPESPWLVRVRAVQLTSANKDSTGLGLSINDKVLPDFDITYFLTPRWAAELVLTYPQKQTVRSNGAEIGSFKHLPPTLTAQYHFEPIGSFRPYLGAGVNYTRLSDVNFSPAVQAALQPSLSKNSFGLALQAGVDYEIAPNWVLNFDIKKLQIHTDVSSAGVGVGKFKIDPWLIGIGIGYRF